MHEKDKRGGISDCGSNAKDATKIIDGESNTFWESFPNDNVLSDWWVDVDLVRLVVSYEDRVEVCVRGTGRLILQVLGVNIEWISKMMWGIRESPNKLECSR